MKHSKSIAISMSILLLTGNMAYATTTEATKTVTTVETSMTQTETISFSTALDKMYKTNIQLVSLENQIKLQESAIKEVEIEAKRYEFEPMTKDNALSRAKTIYVNPITAKNTKSELIRNLDDKKIELKEKLIKYYIDWQTAQNTLTLYNEILKIQQKEYDNKALQFKLGKISSKDLAAAKSNVTTASANVNKTKQDVDLLLLNYNVLINNSYKTVNKPDQSSILNLLKIGSLDFSTSQMDKIIASDIEKDSTLAKLSEQIAVIKEEFRVNQLYAEAGTILSDYEKAMKSNKENREDRILAIEYQVYLDYYTMRSLQSDIETHDENLKLLQLQYDLAAAKVKLGMATSLDLLKAKRDIQEVEYKKVVAQFDLYNAYSEFTKNLAK